MHLGCTLCTPHYSWDSQASPILSAFVEGLTPRARPSPTTSENVKRYLKSSIVPRQESAVRTGSDETYRALPYLHESSCGFLRRGRYFWVSRRRHRSERGYSVLTFTVMTLIGCVRRWRGITLLLELFRRGGERIEAVFGLLICIAV